MFVSIDWSLAVSESSLDLIAVISVLVALISVANVVLSDCNLVSSESNLDFNTCIWVFTACKANVSESRFDITESIFVCIWDIIKSESARFFKLATRSVPNDCNFASSESNLVLIELIALDKSESTFVTTTLVPTIKSAIFLALLILDSSFNFCFIYNFWLR